MQPRTLYISTVIEPRDQQKASFGLPPGAQLCSVSWVAQFVDTKGKRLTRRAVRLVRIDESVGESVERPGDGPRLVAVILHNENQKRAVRCAVVLSYTMEQR